MIARLQLTFLLFALPNIENILDYLKTHENITPNDARRLAGKSTATTRRYLALLCAQGLLVSTGSTSAKTYRRKLPQ